MTIIVKTSFKFKQDVLVVDKDELVKAFSFSSKDLAEEVAKLAYQIKSDRIEIFGSKTFNKKLQTDIKDILVTRYAYENKINIVLR